MKLKLYQVDAFTNQIFGGNPAAVCPLSKWLSDDLMQQIAQENNLSETAFFVPTENGFHLRWFTPVSEVDLCGHATLASGHVIFNHLGYSGNFIEFDSRSGKLGIKKEGGKLVLDFPTDKIEPIETPQFIIEALGYQPKSCYQGREDYLVEVDNQSIVENTSPNFGILKKLKARGVLVTARGKEVDFVSRCFFPAYGIDEDPVTGSAHTTLTPFWAERLGKKELDARQISARGGELFCTLKGDRVELSGNAVTFMIGEIQLP